MARHNEIHFERAAVSAEPQIVLDSEGNYVYGMCYVTVVRGYRPVGDGKDYPKADHPLIMTREPELLDKMKEWHVNDIVDVYGNIATAPMKKTSFCPNLDCIQDPRHPEKRTKNGVDGILVYVNPLYVDKIMHLESKNACMEYLSEHREVSNKATILGQLCREPKKLKTKAGLIVTQYQVALNRTYRVRTDLPENRTDYPWVKSYGENAIEDKMRLHTGSVVLIDGTVQARKVPRKVTCSCCGQEYDWEDRAMEIVPYVTEYMPSTFYTDEDIEKMTHEKIDAVKARLKRNSSDDEMEEGMSLA